MVPDGDTDGLLDEEVNPLGLLVHEYVSPAVEVPPMFTEDPTQIGLLAITVANGRGFIIAWVVPAELVQPLTVIVTL